MACCAVGIAEKFEKTVRTLDELTFHKVVVENDT